MTSGSTNSEGSGSDGFININAEILANSPEAPGENNKVTKTISQIPEDGRTYAVCISHKGQTSGNSSINILMSTSLSTVPYLVAATNNGFEIAGAVVIVTNDRKFTWWKTGSPTLGGSYMRIHWAKRID